MVKGKTGGMRPLKPLNQLSHNLEWLLRQQYHPTCQNSKQLLQWERSGRYLKYYAHMVSVILFSIAQFLLTSWD